MEFFIEFYQYIKQRKKVLLIPTIIILIVLGALIFFTSGSAIAPFIYTLF